MYHVDNKDWRLRQCYYIVDKNSTKILYRRNAIQTKVAQNNSKRKMILKARQFGISTEGITDYFDDTCFTKNMTTVILAHEKDSITKLFRIVHRLYEFMPKELRPRVDRGGGSKYEMYFPELNSRIYCDLESRGDTINRLHVSEAAFMKDQNRLNATLQAVPINTGKVTIETTANGMGNHFYDMWVDPDSVYSKMFFPWFMYPDYALPVNGKMEYTDEEKECIKKAKTHYGVKITPQQIMFRRFKKSELKMRASSGPMVSFEQEYPEDDQTCFLASGNAVINLFVVKQMINDAQKPIRDNGYLKVYEPMNKLALYAIGADTSEGVGGDWSVAVCMDVRKRKVVAKIRGQWKPFEFAHKIKELADLYTAGGRSRPELAVERNNHGHAVILELHEHIEYENLYVHTDEKLGWKTDMITRPIMLNTFINAIDDRLIECDDKEILNECLTLVNDEGKIKAVDGKHDDCIIASSICLQLVVKGSNLSVYENLDKRIIV